MGRRARVMLVQVEKQEGVLRVVGQELALLRLQRSEVQREASTTR